MAELASLVEGFGAPWRPEEVTRLALDRDGVASLPREMLLRDAIAACDWAAPETELEVPRDLILCSGPGTAILREDLPELRGREEARRQAGGEPRSWYPEGHGASWRTGRALILVDLDEVRRARARALVGIALGDLATAAGARPTVDDGELPRSFAGPFEALEALFAAARVRALDRVRDRYYRRPLYPARWRHVRRALRERARAHGTSEAEAWAQAVRANLAALACDHVPGWVEAFLSRLPPDYGPAAIAKRFAAARTRLVQSLREPLNDALTQDFCPGPPRHDDGRAGLAEDRASHDPVCDEMLDRDCFRDADSPEDDWLARIERERRERFLDALDRRLSPRQRELLAAIRSGTEPRVWQHRQGLARGTLDKMLHEIRAEGRNLARHMGLLA
jgi:hypothetical protein